MLHGGVLPLFVQSLSVVQLPVPLLHTLPAATLNPGAVVVLIKQSFTGSIENTVESKPMSSDVLATGFALRVRVTVMSA